MSDIINTNNIDMESVKLWTDKQIIDYLKSFWGVDEFVFECFMSDIPLFTTNKDNYCGSLSQFRTLDGKKQLLYPNIVKNPYIFFNIKKNPNFTIQKGWFKVTLKLAIRSFRESVNNMFLMVPIYRSLTSNVGYDGMQKPPHIMGQRANNGEGRNILQKYTKKEYEEFKFNLKLKNNRFIGLFTANKDGKSFTIRDIRRSDFSKLILQNGKEQQPILFHPKKKNVEDGKYYEFSWIYNGGHPEEYIYLFKVDESKAIKEISAFDLIRRLKNDIMGYPAGAGQKIVKMLDTLKNQLTASGKEIFIYELLQNANDYPYNNNGVMEKVDVEFHITQSSLLFMHSGAEFNERNVAAICSINDKEKTDNKETIGYKGIGFKTVFLDNNYVYLQTGDFSFRFDREETKNIVDTPWQILPIWTDFDELSQSEKNVFTNADKKYRVKFSLHPTVQDILRGSGQNYELMFKEVFKNERVILFIPNLSSVRVFFSGTSVPDIVCQCDNDHWQVNDFKDDVPPEITESINQDIDKQEDTGALKIPTKYYDFTQTKVSFACEIDGAQLKEVEDTNLYCYLPTKASWGFKFLMNTDMIPTGPRDDIEIDFSDQININAEISEIAGRKFFDWIKCLCELKKYKVTSIFNLIPVFETNIREHGKYKQLIERFKLGFDSKIENEELIPVGLDAYSKVGDIILDETGLLSTGIMSDDDFFKITGYEGNLPVKLLRTDRDFKSFIRRYLKQLNCEDKIWDFEELKEVCSDFDFRQWVCIQDNNNKFLDFLLKKNKLGDFLDEEIFIAEGSGELHSAANLYDDVETYIDDLHAFDELIPRLSLSTKEYFKNNEEWNKVTKGVFAKFVCNEWINNILLSSQNKQSTITKLKSKKDTSIRFFNFLSENVSFIEDYLELPFIDDKGKVVDDFKDKFIFLSSVEGRIVCESKWLCSVKTAFLSDEYTKTTKNYLCKHFEVQKYSNNVIITKIILSDTFHKIISDAINNNYDISKEFVSFCYSNKELFENGCLSQYALKVFDCNGKEAWYYSDGDVFFSSSNFDYYSAKKWINSDWIVALDDSYFDISDSKEDLKLFLNTIFGVEELTDKNFYINIVSQHIKEIIKNTSGTNDRDGQKNIDFIKYLDDNYQLIFCEQKDGDIFKSIILVSSNNYDTKINTENLYIYDEELKEIIEKEWFPNKLVTLCHPDYGNSKALAAIGVKSYKFGDFYDEVIVENIDSINERILKKENSIAFHSFIIEHLSSLTPDQQSKMLRAKVFLYGQDRAADSAGKHKTLSAKAKELFDKGLVEFSDLDIIDPGYKTEDNVEYWETRLDNKKFTVTHFFVWLKENADTFSDTIKNRSLNIDFWRWLKSNVTVTDKLKEDIPTLPILLNGNENDYADSDEAIYFSDAYMDGKSLETYVKQFDKKAQFVSSAYISEGDKLETWIQFWAKIGIKQEVLDVIIETIIPSLSEIEDDSLPSLFAEYREKLEKHYGDEFITQLKGLLVKGNDGGFYSLDKCIYIDCEKEEPFTYIELPNQISYETADERRLIKEIIEECDGDCVSTLSEWQQRKVDCYLSMQNDDEDSVRDFHYQFINDLSVIRNASTESLKDIERIKEIYLLNKDNEFCKADSLTMGTVYNPFFDFEKCEIEELDYVSDNYNEKSSEYTGRLFRSLGMHCDFKKDDIHFLEQRICAVYFWNSYLTKSTTDIISIVEMIEKHLLDDISCIPTKDYMKTPGDLYYGEEVSRYVKSIEDWENKIPLKDLPEIKLSDGSTIFEKLPFKESLDFLDALYALVNIKGQDRRTQLLYWMIDTYDEGYDEVINEYREDEHSTWLNTKNEPVQIKELYALDYWNKSLEQYFGSNNPRIINKNYLPAGDSFKEACDILGIMTICAEDLVMVPENDTIFTQRSRALKLFALVIAGKIDLEGWKDRYNEYSNRLETLTLHRCSSIKISYKEDESINQTLKKFYHEKGSDDFYFVKSLDDKRVFQYFVKEYLEYLGIKNDELALELVEDIMDSEQNALDLVKADNFLMIDDDYKNELEVLVPEIRCELSGNMAVEDEDDSVVYRPSFTTVQNDEDDETDDGIVDEKESVEKYELRNYQEEPSSSDGYNIDEEDDDELAESEDTMDNKYNSTGYSSHKPEEHHPSTSRRQIPEYQKPEEYNDIEGDARQEAYGIPSNNKSPQSSSNSSDSSEDSRSSSIDSGQTSKTSNTDHHRQSEKSRREDNAPHPHSHNDYRPHSEPADIPTPKYNPIDELAEEKEKQVFQLEEGDAGSDELAHNDELFEGGLTREEIYDQSTLVKTRVFNDFKEHKLDLEMSEVDFIRKTRNKTNFVVKTKTGTYVHVKSAFNGILYLSPTFWNRVQLETAVVCVILSHKAKNFLYIRNHEDLEKLIGGDQIFVKVKGADKIGIVNQLFGKSLTGAKEKVYTMLRVKTGGKLDYLFQPARSEWDDDEEEQYIDYL